MTSLFDLREQTAAALLLAFLAAVILPACSTTDELGEYSMKYELCDDADAGNMDCPI